MRLRILVPIAVALLLMFGPSAVTSAGNRDDYWVGPVFEGLAEDDGLYGDCSPSPSSEGRCTPPLEVQNATACDRNPVAIDVQPTGLSRFRQGAIKVDYGEGTTDVIAGRDAITVFADTNRRRDAVLTQLRRRSQPKPPAVLPRPVLPVAVRQELVRVQAARKRHRTARTIARATGIPAAAVRTRLRLARLLGRSALRGVTVPRRSWRAVERDRQIAIVATEFSVGFAARENDLTRAQVRRVIRRTRGLAGRC